MGKESLRLLVIWASIHSRLRAVFDVAAHKPRLVLQLPAGALEGVVHGEGQIGVTFIQLGRASNVDLTAVGECKPNAHLVLAASPVVIAGTSDYNPACGEPAKAILQFRNVLLDGSSEFGGGLYTFEFDLRWCLHRHLNWRLATSDHSGRRQPCPAI
jgi:hypothetical protein